MTLPEGAEALVGNWTPEMIKAFEIQKEKEKKMEKKKKSNNKIEYCFPLKISKYYRKSSTATLLNIRACQIGHSIFNIAKAKGYKDIFVYIKKVKRGE